MKNTKKVAFRNLGCKVNEYEMEVMQQRMAENGFLVVPFDTKADIYVINTCTVTNIADRKSRQMLHRAKKENPDAIVVAVGCYVQTDKEGALKDSAVDLCIGNNKKSEIAEIITEFIKKKEHTSDKKSLKTLMDTTVTDINAYAEYEEMSLKRTAEHTRAFVKIQDGCNQFCSYCAIPLARGRIRSRKPDDVINEVTTLSENGYTEVVINGIHLSSYGLDFHPTDTGRVPSYNEVAKDGYFNKDLIDVLKLIEKVPGIERIRLGSLEPRLVTEEFVKELKSIKAICPQFHLSLQSGCDVTLERMNRKYSTDEYRNAVRILREAFDNPAITTDVIVGFPGETDEEFEISKAFVSEIGFYEPHIFRYSRRKNTAADKMPNQIPEEIKAKRSEELISIGEELSDKFRKSFIGKNVEVLFEEGKNGEYTGHTKEYIKVGMRSLEDLSGKTLNLLLDGTTLYFVGK